MGINILAVGREAAILEVVERLINSHEGWSAATAATEKEAVKAIKEKKYAIVLIGAGFSAREEESLRQRLTKLDPAVVVIRHYGGGSGLLENEILGILSQTDHPQTDR